MTFYCGIDLHSKKSQLCIIDKDGKKVKEGNLNNDLSLILEFLEPFGRDVSQTTVTIQRTPFANVCPEKQSSMGMPVELCCGIRRS